MATIRVEPAVLDGLAEELAGMAAGLGGRTDALRGSLGPHDPLLVRALEDLARAWDEGLARLAREAAATGETARGAATAYRSVEAAVVEACR